MEPLFKLKERVLIVSISLATLLSACGESGPSPRKTMPRFFTNGMAEFDIFATTHTASCGYGVQSVDMYQYDETMSDDYLYFPLGSAAEDDELLSLIERYKPLATMMISQFTQTGKKGIVLDLRSNPNQTGKMEKYVMFKGNTNIGVISLRWDQGSSNRVDSFRQLLPTLNTSGFLKATKLPGINL